MPCALRAPRRPGPDRQRRERDGARRAARPASAAGARTSSSSRSAPASAPGSSSTESCTAARRAAPATSDTSRSPGSRGHLPLRERQLPRGVRRRRRARAGRRGGGPRRTQPVPPRPPRRAGLAVRGDVALGAAHGDATSLELISTRAASSARGRRRDRQLLQPLARRHRRGGCGAGDALFATIRQAVYRRSLPLSTRELGVHPRRSAEGQAWSAPRRWSRTSSSLPSSSALARGGVPAAAEG